MKYIMHLKIQLDVLYASTLYCQNCLDKWKKKDNKCPNRCQNPNYQKSLNINHILSNLKFKCVNCEGEIEYNNVEKHHNSCKI